MRKLEILERELALQQDAIERLKQLATPAADRGPVEDARPALRQQAVRW